MTSPPRVVLSLRHLTVFGDEVAFCAPVQIIWRKPRLLRI